MGSDSFPMMFSCTNVYNDTLLRKKCQSGNLYENICPQEKNIVESDMEFLIDRPRGKNTCPCCVDEKKPQKVDKNAENRTIGAVMPPAAVTHISQKKCFGHFF